MEGIEFDLGDKDLLNKAERVKTKTSFLSNVLMQLGVSDPTIANLILASVAALFFGVAIFVYAGIMANNGPVTLSPAELSAGLRALSQMHNAPDITK